MTNHEIALLACMQASRKLASEVATLLDTTDFSRHDHRVIFATMKDMIADGEVVDHVTLPARLSSEVGDDDAAALAASLPGIAADLDDVGSGSDYARIVLDESLRRMLVRGVDRIGSGDVTGQVEALEELVYTARSRLNGDKAVQVYDQASILSPLDALLTSPDNRSELPYPLPGMRRHFGSYEKGRYTLLAGYSGDGKTTFAAQWVEELCEAGARVCVYELEMTGLQFGRLIALQGGGLSSKMLKRAEPMDEQARERYEQRRRQISRWDLTIRTGGTLPQQIRQDQVQGRYDVIVVDHLHKFERTSSGEYADLTRYSGQLHRISRDLDASVIALAQMNKRRDEAGEPDISKIRGGTAMEEDADDAMIVYSDRFSNGMRYEDRRTKLLIGKMRDGQADIAIPMRIDRGSVRFVETTSDPVKVVAL